jgi:hypothetical protein
MRSIMLSLAVSLSGCASYTSTQTRACVTASIAAARQDIAAVRACVDAGSPEPPRGAIDQCIAAGADAALADTEAALACVPEPAAPKSP